MFTNNKLQFVYNYFSNISHQFLLKKEITPWNSILMFNAPFHFRQLLFRSRHYLLFGSVADFFQPIPKPNYCYNLCASLVTNLLTLLPSSFHTNKHTGCVDHRTMACMCVSQTISKYREPNHLRGRTIFKQCTLVPQAIVSWENWIFITDDCRRIIVSTLIPQAIAIIGRSY